MSSSDLALLSSHLVDPILLASTSPQRRVILDQLGVPYDVVAPDYVEHDPPEANAVELVREHARGKARSVTAQAGNRPVLARRHRGVAGREDLRQAGRTPRRRSGCSTELAGETHVVVSGLCLVTPGWELVEHDSTRVTFRELTPRELARHMTHGEWEGRAGAYAIQGRGAALVEEIEGDYLNVVGLPAALLVRILAERFPGAYGYG